MSAAAEKVIEAPAIEGDPVDPLRMELSLAIADTSARQGDVASAKQAVARLTAALTKAEEKRSHASVRAEFERSELIEYLAETAKSRAPETQPISPARRSLAEAAEEAATAQAALEIAQSKRTKADAELAKASAKVEQAISNLMCRDLPKRIDKAKKLHDGFMAASRVLDEVVKDAAELPEDVARTLRQLRRARENLLHFDHDVAYGPVGAWEAARKALRDDCNAPLPD